MAYGATAFVPAKAVWRVLGTNVGGCHGAAEVYADQMAKEESSSVAVVAHKLTPSV